MMDGVWNNHVSFILITSSLNCLGVIVNAYSLNGVHLSEAPTVERPLFCIGFGLASHLGVLSGIPCVGVGKKLFHVDGLEKGLAHKEQVTANSSPCPTPLLIWNQPHDTSGLEGFLCIVQTHEITPLIIL